MNVILNARARSLGSLLLLGCAGSSEKAVDSAASIGTNSSKPDCGVAASPATGVLTANGVGDLRVGATVAEVRSRCDIVEDTTLPGPEGTQERRLTIALRSDSIEAIVDGDRVWRVEVTSSRYRTSDSLGVGSRGWELKRGRGEIATGEGNVAVVREDHCGLSFFVSRVKPVETWRSLPDSALVYRVLAFGCPKPSNPG